MLEENNILDSLKSFYPKADVAICSTSGEIYDDMVYSNSVSTIALSFEQASHKCVNGNIKNFDSIDQLVKTYVINFQKIN